MPAEVPFVAYNNLDCGGASFSFLQEEKSSAMQMQITTDRLVMYWTRESYWPDKVAKTNHDEQDIGCPSDLMVWKSALPRIIKRRHRFQFFLHSSRNRKGINKIVNHFLINYRVIAGEVFQ